MSARPYTMHVLSHTHWDREWYQDFQGFRQRLVYQIDTMMDLLDRRPEYRHFHLDGQTSCLLDYLEIRPDRRARLESFLRSGRVLVGPWFVMPDELLLSGESLVRNLLLGHRLCAEFGADPMPVGYVTDIFGHCSQFPQIIAGFGIDTALLHRGTSTDDEKSEMLWEGADGTEALLIKVYPYTGYQDFLVLRATPEETVKEWERRKLELATTNVLFSLDGNDHQPAYTAVPEHIARVNSIFSEIECVHSSMTEYLTALKAALGPNWKDGLKRFRGELRRPNKMGTWAETFYGTASARTPIKQANDELEYLLPRVAEPLHALSVALGADDQKPFLDLAWRYLLLNHPHDSIVGCSIDQVHRDMMYRFDQSRSLAMNSVWESANAVCDRIDSATMAGEDLVVTVQNSATVDAGPVVRFPFYIPTAVVEEKAREGLAPVLYDEHSNPVYFCVEERIHGRGPAPLVKKIHGDSPLYSWCPDFGLQHDTYCVAVLGDIPALGYRTWRVGFAATGHSVGLLESAFPVSADAEAQRIENDYIAVQAREDGLVDLYDKTTGTMYAGLLGLEDCGDCGEGWNHFYPETDTVVRSTDEAARGPVKIGVQQDSPLSASVTISYKLRVPSDLTPDRKARLNRMAALGVETTLTLDAGSRRVDCRTTIANTARCHRLRTILPTGLACDTWFGDTAFDLVERDVKLQDTTGWSEQAREESPVKNLVAACDASRGLSVLTKGLCEACVQDNEDRSIALTLFRGFTEYLGGQWTEESQLLGSVVAEYAIHPFESNGCAPVGLFREVERYKSPLTPLTYAAHPGELPPTGSLMRVDGDVVLSTVKTAEDGDGSVIRLFNPGAAEARASVTWPTAIDEARLCDMLERPGEAIPLTGERSFEAAVGPKKVVNIRVRAGGQV